MSDTVKLIIEIPKPMYENVQNGTYCGTLYEELKNGTPLDRNSERAEVQAYFDGEAYGWEQGRKALIDDVKAEIEKQIERDFAFAETETLKVPCHYGIANGLQNAIRFLENIGKESEGTNE